MSHALQTVAYHEAGHAIVLSTIAKIKMISLECDPRNNNWFGVVQPFVELSGFNDALVACAGIIAEGILVNGKKTLSRLDLKTLRDDFLEFGSCAKPKMYVLNLANGTLDIKQSMLDSEKVHESLESLTQIEQAFSNAEEIVNNDWLAIEQLANQMIALSAVLQVSGSFPVSLTKHLVGEMKYEWS